MNPSFNGRPTILVTAGVAEQGAEFSDFSISLSNRYQVALEGSGAVPLVLPSTVDPETIAECVSRSDGVMLTGGEDVEPRLYGGRMPGALRRKVKTTPDGGGRDYRELLVIKEVFRQRKPLLAICRGHQLLNVALGGTLYADLPSQLPGKINHGRLDCPSETVHEVRLTPHSLIARIISGQTLGVNSTHHQAVREVAEPLTATAVSGDGVVESLELKPHMAQWLPFCLSVQFHPERLADRFGKHQEIFRAFTHACGSPI
jgi:putative glutamine amidotransferase